MRGLARLVIGVCCALLVAGAIAQPPGAAGLVWLDNKVHFKLNSATLVATGAISTTIQIPAQNPICLDKNQNTLNIQLDLSAFWPGLPTVTLTGTYVGPGQGAGGAIINWSTGPVDINVCLRRDQVPELPIDILIKRITGANLRVNAFILDTPFYSDVCRRDFWVQMDETGGNQYNYLEIEAYAFCVESPFTRINAIIRDADYIAYSGPIPEPASILALGTGLVSLLGLRRRKK